MTSAGKLNLVDLAGSERVWKSGAEGERLKEAQNINRSLLALGDVIQALRGKEKHIPFRNSRLTYLLQDSLGKGNKTAMVVQVGTQDSTVCLIHTDYNVCISTYMYTHRAGFPNIKPCPGLKAF